MKVMALLCYRYQVKQTKNKRKALIQIASGQAKGDGPFVLFAGTFSRLLDPQFVDINAR